MRGGGGWDARRSTLADPCSGYLWRMARVKIRTRKKLTAEGVATQKAASLATREARERAFGVRKTILAEKDGWLVLVRKDASVYRRVRRLEPLVLPAS